MGKQAILKRIALKKYRVESFMDTHRKRTEELKAEYAKDPFKRAELEQQERKANAAAREALRKAEEKRVAEEAENARQARKAARKKLREENQEKLRSSEEGIAVEYVILAVFHWLKSFVDKTHPFYQQSVEYRKPKLFPDPYAAPRPEW